MSVVSQDPRFKEFATAAAGALRMMGAELTSAEQKAKKKANALKELSLGLGVVSILIRSVGFLIRDLGLNFLRTSQRIAATFRQLIEGGGQIEQKFSELQALLSAPTQSVDSFQALKKEIISVGEVSSKTVGEVAELSIELARAGFSSEEITQSIRSVVQLSEAAGLSADKAASIASNVKTMFSLQASELSRVNDVLTQTANASTTSVESLGESFTYVGPLASSFGFSIEEISAALGVLANAGQRGSVAGAGLQQMFSQLIAHSDKVDAILKRHGSSFAAVNPEIKSVTEIMAEFNKVNLSSAEIIEIFSERARKTFLALNSQGIDTLKTFEQMNKSAAGLAASIAETRMDNVVGDILKLRSAFEALQYEVFEAIKAQLSELVQGFTGIVNKVRDFVKNNKDAVAAMADLAVKVAGASAGLAVITLASSTATRSLGLLVGAAATVTATITMLGGPIVKFGTHLGDITKYALLTVKTLGPFGALLMGLKAGFAAVAVKLAIFTAGLLALTAIAGVFIGIIVAIVFNWEKVSKVMNDFYHGTWLPIYYGFIHGFMEGYEKYIKPAMDALIVSFLDLIAALTGGLGQGSETYDSFKGLGELVAALTSAFIWLGKGIVDAFSTAIKAITYVGEKIRWVYNLIVDFVSEAVTGDFMGLKDPMDMAADAIDGVTTELEMYTQVTNDAIKAHNKLMQQMLGLGDGLDQLAPLYEKAGSLLSRMTQLQTNELKELEATITQINSLGGKFTLEGITSELSQVDTAIANLRKSTEDMKKFMDSRGFDESMSKMGMSGGEGRQRYQEMYKQQMKLLEDFMQKRSKLMQAQGGFGFIEMVTGSSTAAEFDQKKGKLKEDLADIEATIKAHRDNIINLSSQVAGVGAGIGFADESQRKAAIEAARRNLDLAQDEAKKLLETMAIMGQLKTGENGAVDVEQFNALRDALAGSADPASAFIEYMRKMMEDAAKTAEAVKAWEEAEKALNETLESSAEMVERLRREMIAAGLDEQSRQEFELKMKNEDALKSIDEFIANLQKARDLAIKAGVDVDSEQIKNIDARLAELNKTRNDFMQHASDEEAKIGSEADQKRADEQLDMELDLAEKRKDQAKEIALVQQKWNKETLDKLESDYTEIDAAGNKRMRAGADEFKRLRQQQLQNQIDDINARYAEEAKKQANDSTAKKPIDRAKEMVDIQNEAYQILLKKVQSTKDLFALERALLKIQEMQLAAALKMSSRAIRAESAVSKAQKAHDEALATGQDPTKTGEALKKAQERARIMRGASDLKNRQAGIGTTDVSAMTVAQQSMDMTTSAVLARIGDKMKVISDALNNMTVTFSSIAETWIDAFIASWETNSIRMQDTVLATLSDLQLNLNTASLGNPNANATTSGTTTGSTAQTAGGKNIINNFNVTALDPLEAGKKMARLIDQSSRDV